MVAPSYSELLPDQTQHGWGNVFLPPGQRVLFTKKFHLPREAPKRFTLGRRRTRREMQLHLTPAAIWLVNYILRPTLKKSRGAWASINITELSERAGAPCRRSLQTAINRLAAEKDALGIVVRCEFGKGRPKLLFASTTWLLYDQEPLFFKEDRKTPRHIRPRCRAKDAPCPHPITQSGVKGLFNNHCADPAPTPFTGLRIQQQSHGFSEKTLGFVRLSRKAAVIRDQLKPKHCDRKGKTQNPGQRDFLKSLGNRHYDNCKVFWNRNTAFSFVLEALQAGHHETKIKAAYVQGLQFAHAIATDEIMNGKRGQEDIAPPALLVWKARQILGSDPRSPYERMKKFQEERAAVWAAAAAQTQEASKWFANKTLPTAKEFRGTPPAWHDALPPHFPITP